MGDLQKINKTVDLETLWINVKDFVWYWLEVFILIERVEEYLT